MLSFSRFFDHRLFLPYDSSESVDFTQMRMCWSSRYSASEMIGVSWEEINKIRSILRRVFFFHQQNLYLDLVAEPHFDGAVRMLRVLAFAGPDAF